MPTTTKPTHLTLTVLSRHTSLLEAVKAAKMDLSYNESEALRDIRYLERGSKGHFEMKPVTEAVVVQNGEKTEVWYRLDCDIKLFNKYEPFCHCIHDGPFYAIWDLGATLLIQLARAYKSCSQNRKIFADAGVVVTRL